jgi:transforming growth factor-beta-induced protein
MIYRLFAITLPLLLIFSSCEVVDTYIDDLHDTDNHNEETILDSDGDQTILDLTAENDDFSFLADAIIIADLHETLGGDPRYTLFAPTNDAFNALFDKLGITAENFLTDENSEQVKEVLLYHIIEGKRLLEDLLEADQINTLLNALVFVKESEGHFYAGNDENGFAWLIEADVMAENGVMHVVDMVMSPLAEEEEPDNGDGEENDETDNGDDEDEERTGTILEIVENSTDLSIYTEAVKFAGLDQELDDSGRRTVFVPTDQAFDEFFDNLGIASEEFFDDANRQQVIDILEYHMVNGNRSADHVQNSSRIRSVERSFIEIIEDNGKFYIGNSANGFAGFVETDIDAANGIIHIIDAVMQPD